jgi:hypothetical protein
MQTKCILVSPSQQACPRGLPEDMYHPPLEDWVCSPEAAKKSSAQLLLGTTPGPLEQWTPLLISEPLAGVG